MLLAGCVVRPDPLQLSDHEQRARGDALALLKKADPIKGQLTLAEAIARGLTDNLDHQLTLMERAINETQLDLIQYDMLPKLAANAGYDWRDRERASTSISAATGEESLTASYSEERITTDASLTYSWSVLDFGLSYFRAKQQADRVLIAVETRRRVINNTTKQIISAYYRAATAEKLLPRVKKTIADAKRAIAAADQTQAEKLLPPDQMLVYKRDLMSNLIKLQNFESQLNAAKYELAALINVPANSNITFAPVKTQKLPRIKARVDKLQQYGLVNRSELREEAYKERIEEENVNQQILSMFPALSVLGSFSYDSNSYLVYNRWRDFGAKAAWNLIDVLKGPTSLKLARAQVDYAKQRRLAISAAVMAQVAISYYQYDQARNNYALAAEMSSLENQILKNARDAEEAQSGTQLDLVRQSVAALASDIERGQQYAAAQTSLADLMTSIGYDLVPPSIENADRKTLISHIDTVMTKMQAGEPIMMVRPGERQAPQLKNLAMTEQAEKNQAETARKIAMETGAIKAVAPAPKLVPEKKPWVARKRDRSADDAITQQDRVAIAALPPLARNRPAPKPIEAVAVKDLKAEPLKDEAPPPKMVKKPAPPAKPKIEHGITAADQDDIAKLPKLSKTKPAPKPVPVKAAPIKPAPVKPVPVIEIKDDDKVAVKKAAPEIEHGITKADQDDIAKLPRLSKTKPEPVKPVPPPVKAPVKEVKPQEHPEGLPVFEMEESEASKGARKPVQEEAKPEAAPERPAPPRPVPAAPASQTLPNFEPKQRQYVPPVLPDHLKQRLQGSQGNSMADMPEFLPGGPAPQQAPPAAPPAPLPPPPPLPDLPPVPMPQPAIQPSTPPAMPPSPPLGPAPAPAPVPAPAPSARVIPAPSVPDSSPTLQNNSAKAGVIVPAINETVRKGVDDE